jgi:hypothetical protein
VEQFKYLETTLTNQNSIQEIIKNRISQGIQKHKDFDIKNYNFACYVWV